MQEDTAAKSLKLAQGMLMRLRPAMKNWLKFRVALGNMATPMVSDILKENSRNEAFLKNEDRVLYSASLVLADALSKMERTDDDYAFLTTTYRSLTILAGWGLHRAAIIFHPDEVEQMLEGDWWEDYTTDFLLSRFRPWTVYVAVEGTGKQLDGKRHITGFYAGFECGKDGHPKLFVQYVSESDKLLPSFYHEFDFAPGRLLGEVVAEYRTNMTEKADLAESLGQTKEELEEVMQTSGRLIGRIAMPLLVTAMGDDAIVRTMVLDLNTSQCKRFTRTPGEGLPIRGKRPDPVEFDKAIQKADIFIHYVKLKRHDTEKGWC